MFLELLLFRILVIQIKKNKCYLTRNYAGFLFPIISYFCDTKSQELNFLQIDFVKQTIK